MQAQRQSEHAIIEPVPVGNVAPDIMQQLPLILEKRFPCVMHFSNTLAETDLKSSQFCPRHEAQLLQALGREGWR